MSDKKKGFFQYVNSKRRPKENIGPVEDGHLTKQGLLLLQSLVILIGLGLASPLRPKTMTEGTVTFYLWTLTR